jgi:monosaccharide-transporting ATPase
VLRVASRVAVLRAWRIVETLPSEDLTVDSLMALVAQPDEFSETASFPTPPTGGGTE